MKARGGVVRFRPPRRGQQLVHRRPKLQEIGKVPAAALVDGSVQLQVNLVDAAEEKEPQTRSIRPLDHTIEESWRQTEVEERCRPRIQPGPRQPQVAGNLLTRLTKVRGERFRFLKRHAAAALRVHERDDVDVPGCAYDQAQKVERGASANEQQRLRSTEVFQPLPEELQGPFDWQGLQMPPL